MSSSDVRVPRLAHAVATAALVALGGCGFHLRGDVGYPFATLYVAAAPATAPIAVELKRALVGTTVVDSAAAAQVILDLAPVADDKAVLSLSGGGRVSEFLLTKRVSFRLHDAEGRDWLPAADIVVRRTYAYGESEVLARELQEAQLLREMQTDAVQQLVRRLQAAKKPG
jgi:LPS-assembly lipoprotein